MKCPKCEEGTLGKIKYKLNGRVAMLCSYCDSLWFDYERILQTTGHTLRTYSRELYDDLDEQDQDHRPDHDVRNL